MIRTTTLALFIAVTSSACATSGVPSAPADNPKADASAPYYWYDGSKKRVIHLQTGMVADFDQKSVLQQAGTQKALSDNQSPVFAGQPGSGPVRALPGGVIVRFDRALTEQQVNARLAPYNAAVSRPIGSSGRTWLIGTDAGMPSLELANTLFESGLVESAAPNWWQERKRK